MIVGTETHSPRNTRKNTEKIISHRDTKAQRNLEVKSQAKSSVFKTKKQKGLWVEI